MVGKNTKRLLYRNLTGAFGSPLYMSADERRRLLIFIRGWLYQHKSVGVRESFNWEVAYLPQRLNGNSSKEPVNIVQKHAALAESAFPITNWQWKINPVAKPPSNDRLGKLVSLVIPRNPDWNLIQKDPGKSLTVIIPLTYHRSVPEQIRMDGRKIVQRAWNRRKYSDKEVWQCSYWDFTGLGRDESTWTKAKWHEGFIVKMDIAISIERSLQRAITMATARTIRRGIDSVLSDEYADGTG